jgi:hypothetical protein
MCVYVCNVYAETWGKYPDRESHITQDDRASPCAYIDRASHLAQDHHTGNKQMLRTHAHNKRQTHTSMPKRRADADCCVTTKSIYCYITMYVCLCVYACVCRREDTLIVKKNSTQKDCMYACTAIHDHHKSTCMCVCMCTNALNTKIHISITFTCQCICM